MSAKKSFRSPYSVIVKKPSTSPPPPTGTKPHKSPIPETGKKAPKPRLTDRAAFTVERVKVAEDPPSIPPVDHPEVLKPSVVAVDISVGHYYERVVTLRAGNILDLIEAKHRAYESCARYLEVVKVTSASLIDYCRPPHVANPMTADCFGGAESMWELATYFTREAHGANELIENELPPFVNCLREAKRFMKSTDMVALWGTLQFAAEHTPRHQVIYWVEFKRRLRAHGVDMDNCWIKEPKS
jgi:hypothetical protein